MAFLNNSSTTGTVAASLTRFGKQTLQKNGDLNITQFALGDPEVNYQLVSVDDIVNTDQDVPDILAQAVLDVSTNENSGDYDGNWLLNAPIYFQPSTVISGNKITDNPYWVQPTIQTDMPSLSGDPTSVFPPALPVTGNVVNLNTFYSITVIATDANGSVINGTIVNLYSNNGYTSSQNINNNTQTIFANLSSNLDYKLLIQNPTYSFSEVTSGGPNYKITNLNSNKTIKFIGTLQTPSSSALDVSGNVINAITSSAISGININLHYGGVTLSATTNNLGNYSFSASNLSANIQFSLNINNNGYYYDNTSTSLTGSLTANQVRNFVLYPLSNISGTVYYYGTTAPISNAVINLNKGLSSNNTSTYLMSVISDQWGNFTFPGIKLDYDYNLVATLGTYTFVNTPYNVPSSSYTASLSGIILYGKKAARPIVLDSPFPLRRRVGVTIDNSELPAFYDPCSWVLFSSKIATIGYAAHFAYSPILYANVLTSTDYLQLLNGLEGPFTFSWYSRKGYTDTLGNTSYSAYISDSYTIKIGLYVLPYKYSLPQTLPQWDEFSHDEGHSTFPAEVNNAAADIVNALGAQVQYIDEVPNLSNQQLAINLQSANNISSLVPRTQQIVPLTLDNVNSIPYLGLLAAQGFDISQTNLNISITPNELANNTTYTSWVNVNGSPRQIPSEVAINDYTTVTSSQLENITTSTSYSLNAVPLPIFLPKDMSIRTLYFTNNLRWQFSLPDFVTILRNNGFIWNRVTSWSPTGQSSYVLSTESTYLTIYTIGNTMTYDQIFFTPDATHYLVADEFKQFLIVYFGVPTTDSATINNLFVGKSLVDWLLYLLLVQHGSYKNGYANGTLSHLWTIANETKFGLVSDLIVNGNTTTTTINTIASRQYQPSTNTLSYFTSIQSAGSVSQVTTAPTQQSSVQASFPSSAPTVSGAALPGQLQNSATTTTSINNTGATNASLVGGQTNFNISSPSVHENPGLGVSAPITTTKGATTTAPSHVVANNTNEYAAVAQTIVGAWNTLQVNKVFVDIYGLTTFDYRLNYVILILALGQTTVTNAIQIPTTKLNVVTSTITPVLQRLIRISNGNNYFNLNSSLEKQLTMTLSFDITQPGCIDNFMRAINFLNDNLYTLYLGVEIIDDGQITNNYNQGVELLPAYLNADVVIQDAFCLKDKVQWFVPLTIGGVTTKGASQISVGDPTTFKGRGFIKLVPFNNGTTAHIIRVIALSDLNDANTSLVDVNQLTGTDYIAFQIFRINNWKTFNFASIKRVLQILEAYDYNSMNADLQDLIKTLSTTYASVPDFVYAGYFSPGFGNSTKGPDSFDASVLTWPQGATPLAELANILATGKSMDIGTTIISLSQFTV